MAIIKKRQKHDIYRFIMSDQNPTSQEVVDEFGFSCIQEFEKWLRQEYMPSCKAYKEAKRRLEANEKRKKRYSKKKNDERISAYEEEVNCEVTSINEIANDSMNGGNSNMKQITISSIIHDRRLITQEMNRLYEQIKWLHQLRDDLDWAEIQLKKKKIIVHSSYTGYIPEGDVIISLTDVNHKIKGKKMKAKEMWVKSIPIELISVNNLDKAIDFVNLAIEIAFVEENVLILVGNDPTVKVLFENEGIQYNN